MLSRATRKRAVVPTTAAPVPRYLPTWAVVGLAVSLPERAGCFGPRPRATAWGQKGVLPSAVCSLGCPAQRWAAGLAGMGRQVSVVAILQLFHPALAHWGMRSWLLGLAGRGGAWGTLARVYKEPSQGGERSGFGDLQRQTPKRDCGDWLPPSLDKLQGRGTPAPRWVRMASGIPRTAANPTYSGKGHTVVGG